MADAALFRCRLSGWLVQPISTEPPILIGGATFIQWTCCACDAYGHTRGDADYMPSQPGVHVRQIGSVPAPSVWRSRWAKEAV